jgi:hypothetical protein
MTAWMERGFEYIRFYFIGSEISNCFNIYRTKMKYLLILLLAPCLSFGQQKKDNKIIVTVSDTANLFNRVIKTLYAAGYIVDVKDEENNFLSTKEKSLPKDASTSVIIKAFINSNIVTFSGEGASNVTFSLGGAKAERTFTGIYYGGMKGSSLRNSWNELDAIAKQLGGIITYSK